MSIRTTIVRPDDLLNLRIEAVNMRLDTSDVEHPALVAEVPAQPSYLVVEFPPQTIVEEAFFESSALQKPPKDPSKPEPTAPTRTPDDGARSRIGGPSRLVFRVPSGKRIPYTHAGLLDWSDLDLNVSPIADVPEDATAAQRQAAPPIAEPAPLVTALELPYRLVLSPAHDVAWEHALGLKSHAGRTELWHTRLMRRDANGKPVPISRQDPAPLRAIWSPDYRSTRFFNTDPPFMGEPDKDWDFPSGVLTAMTPSDRHEIVILTSGFHGFIKGRRTTPPGIDYSTFVPTPIHAEQVMLSPLGGWLKSRGQWDPPMPWRLRRIITQQPARRFDDLLKFIAQPRVPMVGAAVDAAPLMVNPVAAPALIDITAQGLNLFEFLGEHGDSLNMSEWVHVATQGRDHYVRIVYEGFVYGCRHRAALIKVTERKFTDGKNGSPIAYLAQRMFVVIRQPELDYEPERTADAVYGRHMPFRRWRFTTRVTPDIDLPAKIDGTEYSFWIKVGTKPFRFHAVGEDLGGHRVDFTTALIFVPFSDFNETTIAAVRKEFRAAGAQRSCPVPGQAVTFAEQLGPGDFAPGQPVTDNATLTTKELYFDTDSTGSGDTFTFRPLLMKAAVRLPAVEQLLGREAASDISYYESYLASGFGGANTTGLFAQIAKETQPGVMAPDKVQATFSADQAGGISTPNLSISGITRKLGPLAGDNLAKLAADDFNPADFFKGFEDAAKLFGSIKLIDLLLGGTMDGGAPKMQLTTEEVAGQPNRKKLVATLHWAPKVHDASAGIVHLRTTPQTAFNIDGRVERIVEVPGGGSPGPAVSRFSGEMTNFTVDLLNVVALMFDAFRFESASGSKPSVNVDLQDDPLKFEGDLEFVNELQNFVPPGLFGDGASLVVSPASVKAGFGIGLPPVSIGVFSLSGVTLNAGLELPFVEGKPLFDFAISSREHPFNLTVAFLGGGGFFHLQLDTDGIRQLEAALEFGASASIDLGVASGGVHIMAGIYFSMGVKNGNKYSILAGYLRMGGELSVLGLISISLEFVLSFAYEDGKAAGRATLTVKVEVLFFSTSVEISVEKRFGGSSGDPRFFQVFETPAVWNEYAIAFA